MPRCRKEKKVPLRNDDMIGDIRNSAFRGRENNLRDYGDYADSRMKDMYGYKKASNIYNDKSSNPRSHQQWNDYDRTRPVNLYKADDNLYTREIREPFEPRQIPRAPNPPNSLYNEVPVSRNFRDAYEPQYIPVKTVRSNNYLDDISESRNVRDVYEPRQIPTYPSRSNNFSDVSIVPSSISNNGNTYSYSMPQRQNLKIIREAIFSSV
ncbi:hypothetical protein EWB00_000062 [Schistosoma japonicum]|uniref:Uncharacterized protein n=1 Tax=Schistosoma japonicum TaxID=6182 RepID=A0A4Z2DK87_SCHJA|nr:hypothetical protein EWB00_000062 [Schistosoma japonicum]